MNDLGVYKCIVSCGDQYHSATLNVMSKKSFFNVTYSTQFSHFDRRTSESAEMTLVKYQAYPEPKLEWFDKNNRSIKWTLKEDINTKFEAFCDLTKKWTVLKIRNATVLDSGRYTLAVQNGTLNKVFEMLIKGIQ